MGQIKKGGNPRWKDTIIILTPAACGLECLVRSCCSNCHVQIYIKETSGVDRVIWLMFNLWRNGVFTVCTELC